LAGQHLFQWHLGDVQTEPGQPSLKNFASYAVPLSFLIWIESLSTQPGKIGVFLLFCGIYDTTKQQKYTNFLID
jgi:hypothetical protein